MEVVRNTQRVFYFEPEELARKIERKEDGFVIIDVRGPSEEKIRGAVFVSSIAFDRDHVEAAVDLSKYDDVIIHCMYSKERGPTCAALMEMYYPKRKFTIHVLRGGFCMFATLYPHLVEAGEN